MQIKYGWIKDDNIDIYDDFENVKSGLVKYAVSQDNNQHIIQELTPISNQLNLGSCVSNSVCDSLEILMGIQNPNSVVQLSRLFVYYNARKQINATNVDNGCFITHAALSLKNLGCCLESTWEYDVSKVFLQPNLKAYSEANDNKIKNFYRISSSNNNRVNDIEKAIRANHPVIFGTLVHSGFGYANDINKVWDPPSSDNVGGGHAMIITGIRINAQGKKEFYIRNSWGQEWNSGTGHFWASEEYVKTNNANDFIVPTLIPDLVF